ncbi:hypothetical protein KB977_004626 [Vibrio parahaemolyticus]|nr:hypothetical protein [Vibrio parahaemolyticus]EHK0040504.1 hypothetical protein [Vibrio parahaemolyticus]EIU7737217.1 hypothetical protein [Vibrio parahaemolyticus]EKA7364749.1 hypothetical protein [Vibrio parahaemolyticus]HAS6903199.1 hypothetical protein [Vibrio parahaemolyticus]
MAFINELVKVNDIPKVRSGVSADYCFNESAFQIRTYKDGDSQRTEGSKQNLQLNKKMARELIAKLQDFVDQ